MVPTQVVALCAEIGSPECDLGAVVRVAGGPSEAVVWELLCSQRGTDMRVLAVSNRHLPAVFASQLCDDQRWEVQAALGENPTVSAEVCERLARNVSPGVRVHVAKRPDVSPGVLTELSEDPASMVRRAVAQNPSTPQAGSPNCVMTLSTACTVLLLPRTVTELPYTATCSPAA